MRRARINIEKVARVLSRSGYRPAQGAYVVDVNGTTCRCPAGELAHAAGVDDGTLRYIDRFGALQPCPQPYSELTVLCRRVDDVLLDAYGLTPTDRDAIINASDECDDESVRVALVLARLRDINYELEDSA